MLLLVASYFLVMYMLMKAGGLRIHLRTTRVKVKIISIDSNVLNFEVALNSYAYHCN